jgi:hypothetical protein
MRQQAKVSHEFCIIVDLSNGEITEVGEMMERVEKFG